MTDLSSRLEQLSPAKRALLEKLAARGGAPPAADVVRPREGSGPAPLSFGQQRLWFLDRLQPGTPRYTIPVAFWLRGRLDVRALRAALGEVVSRHEALRTVFREVQGTPLQLVLPRVPAPLDTADLRALPEAAREAEAERRVRDFLRLPFDLARGPLLRAFAVRTGDEAWTLALGVHHVASDGWSQGILLRELSAAYAARVGGGAAPLPAPRLQYPDYAAWQRGTAHARVLDEQLAWWRERLGGTAPVLELPADRPRPAALGQRGAKHFAVLPAELAERAEAFARGEGASPFMTLLAAFQLLLGRLAGEEEVRVGTPVANRGRPETEGVVGFFVNTLVLRGDLSGDPTFRELVARVREETLGAFARPDLPFERLVEELHPERSLNHAPLVQVAFALQNAPDAPLRLPGCDIEETSPDLGVATLDLDVHLRRSGRGLELMARYSTDLWDAPSAARLAERYERLLRGALASPDARVSGLPLLDDAERERVLRAWNATERPYPAGLRVHDLFAAQAARTPDAVAVSWRGERTTYAELERRANRVANALRRRGVGPETRVGVCMGRTPELLAALLGVLGAGGAYVPLDPAYPRERLAWMVEDAGIRVVLTEARWADGLPDNASDVLVLEREGDALAAEPETAPESGVLPENLSHVIFTSGSTGRPKGVMIRHSSVVVLLHWLREVITDEERSCVLFATSINFDVSVAEVFGTLCWGGKLVLVENALELPAAGEPVVCASMVPSAAAELLHGGGIPASVRTLNLGGEALPAALARALYDLGTVAKVGNLYGPTEDTTYSTYSRVERGAAQVLVGRPVANTRAYVLDRHRQPVPAGVAGEMYLAGDGLARGYASRPGLTAERFLPDPFGEPGARMYRVMDRVRHRPDGELEYLGRTDFQVKVRGFRIEPGEIEAALLGHPAVRAAVAVVREDGPARGALVAYVAADEPPPTAAELRGLLKRSLPEYMVPGAFVVLEALPLTPSGKVDRRALPAPDASSAPEAYVAPRTPEEETLAAIWAELLGV
ncbi:MAG TPA: amino acid adenylation domain-containing protein, partial [Longimicrobiaceae bacterium]|nr:amino acid adenylation domain-containing protein [Longimicrobiaceae bacterium]